MTFQRFQSVCDFYYLLNKAAHWLHEVLDRLSFKDAVWDETTVKESSRSKMVYISLIWRKQNLALLSQVSPHNPEDWKELAKLSNLLPENMRNKGIQLSSRCLLLWNILTNSSRQVHQSDLQQLISLKNSISKDPAQEIPSLDFSTYDFSVFSTKIVCDLKSLPHADKLQAVSVEHLGNKKPSQSLRGFINPWLSLPLANFSNGSQQHIKIAGGAKQAKNTFDQVCASKQMRDNSKPYYLPTGVQIIGCEVTEKTCGVQTESFQSLSTTDLNCCHSEHSTCNQLIKWEEEVLCNIEDLLGRAEAILEEEEDACNQKKSKNSSNDQQQLPGYHNAKNSAELEQGYIFLDNRCLDSAMPDTNKEYNSDLQMKNQNYLRNMFQELEELYAIEECIMEENRKIKELLELMQREVIEEQQTFFKQVKQKVLFLNALEREMHHVEKLEKSLAREEAKKHKQIRKKEQVDKIKKYCQSVVKENIRLIAEPQRHHLKEAEPELNL